MGVGYINCIFSFEQRHNITLANRNVYKVPVLHPNRYLEQHVFIYMIEGSWEIGIGENCYSVCKDDVIILPAKIFHHGITECEKETKTFFFHTTLQSGDGTTTDTNIVPSDTRCVLPVVISAKNNHLIKDYFSEIILSYQHENRLKTSVVFDMLLLELTETQKALSQNNDIALHIKEIIDSSLYYNISNTDIALKLCISVKTAEKRFKETYKTTIHQYILKKKLCLAQEMLKFYPDMKIYEIAEELKFSDQYHFSNSFKKQFGKSPQTYRRSINKQNENNCV